MNKLPINIPGFDTIDQEFIERYFNVKQEIPEIKTLQAIFHYETPKPNFKERLWKQLKNLYAKEV